MLTPPLSQVVITSPFGERVLKGSVQFHPGIDFRASDGTEVFAADEGICERSYTSIGKETDPTLPKYGYGERIILSHAGKLKTTYNHLSQRLVKEGDAVSRGQLIGYSGNTGYSFGPHLHFEVTLNGALVNPEEYLGTGIPHSSVVIESKGVLIVGGIALVVLAIGAAFIIKGS